jgi:hypothetical protein
MVGRRRPAKLLEVIKELVSIIRKMTAISWGVRNLLNLFKILLINRRRKRRAIITGGGKMYPRGIYPATSSAQETMKEERTRKKSPMKMERPLIGISFNMIRS